MISSGRSCLRLLTFTSRSNFSSKANKFDPRTEAMKKILTPWYYKLDYKKTPSFLRRFVDPTGSSTDILKFLTTPLDFRTTKIKSWLTKQLYQREIELQAYDPDRQAEVGSDVSVGHALLPIGAGLLYKGKPWMKKEAGKLEQPELPLEYEDGWHLEAIDLSGCPVRYEGFCSFQHLNNLHTIIAQKCPYLDDWCLDILSSEALGLEVLDLSGCENISARGLAALTRLPNLHTLNLSDCPAFQTNDGILSCLLLEEYNHKLHIVGVEYPNEAATNVNSSTKNESSPSVV